MKHESYTPLSHYSQQLVDLFQQAITQADPASFLYKKDVRSNLFMAESLARLLDNISGNKKSEKPLKIFKKLEDQFGKLNFYDELLKSFSKKKTIHKDELAYLTEKRDKVISKLNTKLIKKDFYQDFFNGMAADKIDFNNKELIKKIRKQLDDDLTKSFEFYKQFPEKFTDFESQVHELRRNLRWLSIYAQSLGGIITLKTNRKKNPWEKEFISATSLKSSFNKLPVKKDLAEYIVFDQKVFYGLNGVVDKLGILKDKALAIEQLQKTIRKTRDENSAETEKTAFSELNIKYTEDDLLTEAHVLLNSFFVTHQLHSKLLG